LRFKSLILTSLLCIATVGPTLAQSATPEGSWRDKYGTIFDISLCGGGTDICAILIDIQGESRTEENLAYVNQQVLQASQTAANEWQGTVIYNGSEAAAKVTQNGPDSLSIQGCRAAILCQTLVFNRIDPSEAKPAAPGN
jgi:uncharacterized protein (DUF2147 family)